MNRLKLPTVTLCAASSVNVVATLTALRACLDQGTFAQCLLFTDAEIAEPGIEKVPIARLNSSQDYSRFIVQELADHIQTEHCLIVQWDGFILNAGQWTADFLEYDYIGAPWPQFSDGHDVGNGGFSLRSRRLLEACRDPAFRDCHPEDVAVCRQNRALLESKHGIRFADRSMAARFAFERTAPPGPTFGFHGIFNMSDALGRDRFWEIYSTLDDRHTALVDYRLLMGQLGGHKTAWKRRGRLTLDAISSLRRGSRLR